MHNYATVQGVGKACTNVFKKFPIFSLALCILHTIAAQTKYLCDHDMCVF